MTTLIIYYPLISLAILAAWLKFFIKKRIESGQIKAIALIFLANTVISIFLFVLSDLGLLYVSVPFSIMFLVFSFLAPIFISKRIYYPNEPVDLMVYSGTAGAGIAPVFVFLGLSSIEILMIEGKYYMFPALFLIILLCFSSYSFFGYWWARGLKKDRILKNVLIGLSGGMLLLILLIYIVIFFSVFSIQFWPLYIIPLMILAVIQYAIFKKFKKLNNSVIIENNQNNQQNNENDR